MSIKRWNARRDKNEPAIVDALEAFGASVIRSDAIDLIVGFRGKNFLLEVKSADNAALKDSQKKLLSKWAGDYKVVHCIDDAINAIME
jgi:hypothetical protein